MSSNKEDNMTTEEREDWLKSHGITIETPEDRRAAATGTNAPILHQLHCLHDLSGEIDGVDLAFIPCDDSKPLRSVRLPPGLIQPGTGDAVVEFTRPYFATNKQSIDAGLLKEQASKQFAGGNIEGLDTSKLSVASMNAVAAQGSVEVSQLY